MQKIFEKIEYQDGGPNDRGMILGYEIGESADQLRQKYGITHGHISFYEISPELYLKRRDEAARALGKFNLDLTVLNNG